MKSNQQKRIKKTLFFEGAGWSDADISKNAIGNCRIRSAFHLDNGRPIYLEISAYDKGSEDNHNYCGVVDDCFYINEPDNQGFYKQYLPIGNRVEFAYTRKAILNFVNKLGASFDTIDVLPDLSGYRTHAENSIEGPQHYHYGDEFKFDPDMTARREAAFNELYKQEKAKGVRYPNIQLCVDETDPGLLHLLHRKFGPQGYCTIRTDTGDTIEDWMKSLTEPK